VKKQVAFILAVMVLFNLTGCLERGNKSEFDLAPTKSITALPSATDSVKNTETNEPTATPISSAEMPKEEPPVFSEVVRVSSKVHTQIAPEKYYQKSFLSASEKKIYEKFVDAAMQGRTAIPVRAYRCSAERINCIFYAVKADYPQLFYLSGYYNFTIDYLNKTVKDVRLVYFDGTITDEYDSTLKLIKAADRKLIGRQIKEFNRKVLDVVDKIPADISNFDKEKMIYEYIQGSVALDKASNDSPPASYSEIKTHSFDSFGAACEGKAVCEGYAELFQYLCYCVGINATIVRGKTTRASHMWNAICLDSEWYMVDPTWDDADMNGLHCYGYFNVTEAYIKSIGRTINDEDLNVPSCTATKYAFYNMYGLYTKSTSEAPVNYQKVIDYVASNNDKHLCLYVGNLSGDMVSYIQRYILSPDSELQQYIAEKDYQVRLQYLYIPIGNYCYIAIE